MFNPFDLIVTLRSVENSKRKILPNCSILCSFSIALLEQKEEVEVDMGEETSVRDVLFGPAATMNIFNAEYYCATEQKILIRFEWS